MSRRTLGWYAEHPRAFDEAVEAWQEGQVDAYLDGGGYRDGPGPCPGCGEHIEDCECAGEEPDAA